MNVELIKKAICSFVLVMVCSGTFNSFAQPSDDPPDNPPVPISGIGYLLALGGALGIKKIYDLRDKNRIE